MNILYRKGVSNIFWGVLGKFFSGLKLALLGIIVARYLGPKDFGLVSYVISFVTLLSVLAEFRLHNILVREVSEKKNSIDELLGSSLSICFFFASIGYITLSIIVFSIKDDINVKAFLLIYGLSYFFQSFRFLRAYFIAYQKNNTIIAVETITAIIILLIALLLIFFKASIIYFIILRTIDFLFFSFGLFVIYNKREGNFRDWKINRVIRKQLIKDSLPLVLSGFALIAFQRIDQVMIRFFTGDYDLGQYSAAVSITSIIAFVPIIISESLTPAFIKVKNESSLEVYDWFRQRFSDFITWGSILLSLLIMIFSSFIINTLYGDDYLPAINVMEYFSWKGVLIGMGAVAGQIMIIENNHQIAYIKSVIAGIVNIVLNFIFIPSYGMIGAVWASLIAFSISSYFSHFFMRRYRYIFNIQTKSIFYGLYYIFVDLKKFMKIAMQKI